MNIKKLNKQNHTSNNGITLIALVITIIVMLIIVAVTISLSVNGGLFSYAGNAARETGLAKQDEQKLSKGQLEIDGKKYNSPEDYINGEEARTLYSEDLLDENGVLTENAFYKDINNAIVEIPKGFKISSVASEQTKEGGLVIQDEDDNEFVWVPVNYTETGNINSKGLDSGFLKVFYRSKWISNDRTTGLSTDYREPYSSAQNWEKEEYNNMMKSVQEHRGFYIGRYEAGTPTTENPRCTNQSNYGTSTMVIKRDCYPYIHVAWGASMTDYTSDIIFTDYMAGVDYNLGKGAVYLCKNMYPDESHNVTSTLCYGIQWDAMLDFIKDSTHNVTSSKDWGNYQDFPQKITRSSVEYYAGTEWKPLYANFSGGGGMLTTGAHDSFQAKNIFDVAGNCSEWTMESYKNYRVLRGRDHTYYGEYYPVSDRDYGSASSTDRYHSFRVALYL